ncbi:hypothetical protein [Agromyces neolithicus]|uniref:Uncharacterized protein n=1 Tax=Agromyces neolithicus TaxID=269420 RepID=A0ABN2MBH7_9MICO
MNTTTTPPRLTAAFAAAALIASLAGCAGTADVADPPQKASTGFTDVAERRLWMRTVAPKSVADEPDLPADAVERRLLVGEVEPSPSTGFTDVAERRLWMR